MKFNHPQETLVCRKYPWKQSENVYYPQEMGRARKNPLKNQFFFGLPTPWKYLFIKYSLEIFTSSLLPSGNAEVSTSPQKISRIRFSPSPPKFHSSMGGSSLACQVRLARETRGIISINWNSPLWLGMSK